MSNAFAIAGVTAAVQNILRRALSAATKGGIFDGETPIVTALPPDMAMPANKEKIPRLNIFLYELTSNTGHANTMLGSRTAEGLRATNAPLALDLGYIMSAHAREDLQMEVLLGHGMQALHEIPGLSREQLRRMFDLGTDGDTSLSAQFRARVQSLAQQMESLKISLRYPRQEEMSKIWATFQTHYRPCVSFLVTVVLIEAKKATRTPLPVLTRGEGDQGVFTESELAAPFPTILATKNPGRQTTLRAVNDGPIKPDKLKIYGHHLRGSARLVRFRHTKVEHVVTVQGASLVEKRPDLSDEELAQNRALELASLCLEVDLGGSNDWRPGPYLVEVELILPGESQTRTSNALPVGIAPEFFVGAPKPPVVTKPTVTVKGYTIQLTTKLKLSAGQTVALVLGNREITGHPDTTIGNPTTEADFFEPAMPPELIGASPRARLIVDGVESPIIIDEEGKSLRFDESQRILIPA